MIGILTHIIEPLFAALNTSGWDTGLKSRLAIYIYMRVFENNIRSRISDKYIYSGRYVRSPITVLYYTYPPEYWEYNIQC